MAYHQLSDEFGTFFDRINPTQSYEEVAAREYESAKRYLLDPHGPAAAIGPSMFLQGSYRQDTAIHSINDVDIVVLFDLVQPGSGQGRTYSRDEIYNLVASSLNRNSNYYGRVHYGPQSLCVKVDLSIRLEILPAVKKTGARSDEPFRIHRSERRGWIDAYARRHQALLTEKNQATDGNLKPMIKVIKHLRDTWSPANTFNHDDAVSFHIECLLYAVPNGVFNGNRADVIQGVFASLAGFSPDQALRSGILSPCRDKVLFSAEEWLLDAYARFHTTAQSWLALARAANGAMGRSRAIYYWKLLLGGDYFPG